VTALCSKMPFRHNRCASFPSVFELLLDLFAVCPAVTCVTYSNWFCSVVFLVVGLQAMATEPEMDSNSWISKSSTKNSDRITGGP
jgi:hypothetical protein